MKQNVINIDGKNIDTVELSDKIFSIKPSLKTLKSVVNWQINNAKPRTAKTKQRNEVMLHINSLSENWDDNQSDVSFKRVTSSEFQPGYQTDENTLREKEPRTFSEETRFLMLFVTKTIEGLPHYKEGNIWFYARVENKSKIVAEVLPNPFNTSCDGIEEDDTPAELITHIPQDPLVEEMKSVLLAAISSSERGILENQRIVKSSFQKGDIFNPKDNIIHDIIKCINETHPKIKFKLVTGPGRQSIEKYRYSQIKWETK